MLSHFIVNMEERKELHIPFSESLVKHLNSFELIVRGNKFSTQFTFDIVYPIHMLGKAFFPVK